MLKKRGQVPVPVGLGKSREHRREEMQQLGSQKTERAGHLQEHESRRGQTAPHQFLANPVGYLPFLIRGLEIIGSFDGERVPPTASRLSPVLYCQYQTPNMMEEL